MERRVLALFTFFAVSILSATSQENTAAYGIIAVGERVYLLAETRLCAAAGSLPKAQIFVSDSDGQKFRKVGPSIEGSKIEFYLSRNDRLWLAGIHTAEGPSIDPFLLVPLRELDRWHIAKIYSGPSDLKAVAIRDSRHFRASIQAIDRHTDSRGPEFDYLSSDGGQTWRRKRAEHHAATRAEFQRLETESSKWRIIDLEDGGFAVQKRMNTTWKTTSEFALRQCR